MKWMEAPVGQGKSRGLKLKRARRVSPLIRIAEHFPKNGGERANLGNVLI
jgi:hypothetical protein